MTTDNSTTTDTMYAGANGVVIWKSLDRPLIVERRLQRGDPMTVLKRLQDGWMHVQLPDGAPGFVQANALTAVPYTAPAAAAPSAAAPQPTQPVAAATAPAPATSLPEPPLAPAPAPVAAPVAPSPAPPPAPRPAPAPTSASADAFCGSCGRALVPNNAFCGGCGAPIQRTAPTDNAPVAHSSPPPTAAPPVAQPPAPPPVAAVAPAPAPQRATPPAYQAPPQPAPPYAAPPPQQPALQAQGAAGISSVQSTLTSMAHPDYIGYLVANVVLFISALLPWLNLEFLFQSESRNGLGENRGWFIVVAIGIAGGLTAWALISPLPDKLIRIAQGLAGAVAILMAILQLSLISDYTDTNCGDFEGCRATAGIGVYFAILGGIALIALAIFNPLTRWRARQSQA